MSIDRRAVPKIKYLFLALALIVGLTGFPRDEAQAAEAEPGWYVGFGLGEFREATGALLEESGQSTGRQYFAGYDIYGFLSIEVGLIDLDGPVDTLNTTDTKKVFNISGPFARGNLAIPIYSDAQTRVSLFGSAGAMRWDSHAEIKQTGMATITANERDISPVVGGGIWIRRKNASTRIEYQRFKDIDDPTVSGSEMELRLVMISIIYHF